MQGLRFSNVQDFNDFYEEFDYSIPARELGGPDPVFRFDLIRQIFLDRGLWIDDVFDYEKFKLIFRQKTLDII